MTLGIYLSAKLYVYYFQRGINRYLKVVVKLMINFFRFSLKHEMETKHYLRGGI